MNPYTVSAYLRDITSVPALLPEAPAWHDLALCAETDPEAFFPEKGGSTREAKRVCRSCEVRASCLDYALTTDQRFGIWGGMSERERRRLRYRFGRDNAAAVASAIPADPKPKAAAV